MCLYDSCLYFGGAFGRRAAAHFVKIHSGSFDMYIYPVKQRSAYPAHIFRYLAFLAGTFLRIAMIAAGTRVHACNEHKACGIGHCAAYARDRYLRILQRLAQFFKHGACKLGQLVKKKYAVVRQADLSGLRHAAAADHGHIRYSVVRRAERALCYKRVFVAQKPCNGIYLCYLYTFFKAEVGQDAWHTLCHHGLARAGRAYHQHVVHARSCYLQRTLHALLTLYIAEIQDFAVCRVPEHRINIYGKGNNVLFAFKHRNSLQKVADGINLHTLYECRFFCVVKRHYTALYALFVCKVQHWQNTVNGTHRAVK